MNSYMCVYFSFDSKRMVEGFYRQMKTSFEFQCSKIYNIHFVVGGIRNGFIHVCVFLV